MRSATSSAIDRVWVDMNTVSPCRVRSLRVVLTRWMLRGSRPTHGSSTTTTRGSWRNVAAKESFWRMPWERSPMS